jgi:phytoene desaturase
VISVGVIGAGIGGMSAAIRLAGSGYKVTVFEKNNTAGGKAGSIECEGFRFDTGPSLLTMTDVLKELFDSSAEDINAYLDIRKLDNLCRYFYSDGTLLNAYSDMEKFFDEAIKMMNVTRERLAAYSNYTRRIYDLTKDIFLFDSYKGMKSFLNFKSIKTLLQVRKIDSFRTIHEANKSFFEDERLVQLYDRYATYNGSNPYSAPATLNLISHVENALGGYYLADGMYGLTKGLYKLAEKKGVEFKFGEEVTGINRGSSSVISLSTAKEKYTFDYYVSNIDSITTNERFLGESTGKVKDELLSTSAMVFYWGIKGEHRELDTHNILFSNDYRKEFNELFEERAIPNDPTVYIYISSKFAKKDAPEGYENWFVMINTPSNFGQDWKEEAKNAKKTILKKIEKMTGKQIEGNITFERVLNPKILEDRTGSYKGSIYGYSSNTKFAAFKRQPNRSKSYDNLYYCGGSAHPGGGIPLVILSGKNVAEMIKADYRKQRIQ